MSTYNRKLREKEERANLILNAAERVMTAHGLYGLSMDLVAQEAELAKGTVYLYFASKDDLLAELTRKAMVQLLEEFRQAADTKSSPIRQLEAIILTNYNFARQHPLAFELISLHEVNNKSSLLQRPELQRASADITALIVDICTRAKKDGSFNKSIKPKHFAFCLWGMTIGILQLIKVRGTTLEEQQHISEQELFRTYTKLLLNGIIP